MAVFLLDDKITFPPPHMASDIGLLAIGGDLSVERLRLAYQMGIFPWYSEGEPIMWWSPDPRLVLYLEEIHVSTSLRKAVRKNIFKITVDHAFDQVIRSCAKIPRRNNEGTWITKDMIDAYIKLHAEGLAHSVEAWHENELVGGLYGVALEKCFFGESMFAKMSNASKVAFITFVHHLKILSFKLIDCQVTTEHLKQFGAREIPRRQFIIEIQKAMKAGKSRYADRSLLKPAVLIP